MEGLRALFDALRDRVSSVLGRHGRKLWWIHSFYALGLGVSVLLFAQKGFAAVRWLSATVVVAWLLVVVVFRLFGGRAEAEAITSGKRMRFLVMTYVLKNLYQGMLFFLLPFYWKSSTPTAINFAFTLLLGACALVSTLDVLFDELVMRSRVLASVFHGFTLFASFDLLVPALFPEITTLHAQVVAALVTVLGFWSLHVSTQAFAKNRTFALLFASLAAGAGLAWFGRAVIPPVPMHLASGAVGPYVLGDGRLGMEVKTLRASELRQLVAVTNIVAPGGDTEGLHHVWRREGDEVFRATKSTLRGLGQHGAIRLSSKLEGKALPKELKGVWSIDVETPDGQLVGRVGFTVAD